MITVAPYTEEHRRQWDEFVDASRNGTFLLRRDYMTYHADRFTDRSLMFYDDHQRLIALLPANIDGDTLASHAGLTYGGLVLGMKGIGAPSVIEAFDALRRYCLDRGIRHIIYKPVPNVFHRYPCDEDIYALFRNDARLLTVNISSAIDLDAFDRGTDLWTQCFNMSARQDVRRAAKAGVVADESDDLDTYWQMLTARLDNRYHARPVHTVDEMRALKDKFPDHIRLVMATLHGDAIGGVVVYLTDTCIHTQYTATTERGRDMRVLPLITKRLIELYGAGRRYVDFGTSNEEHGRVLNTGLIQKKCDMGGRGIAYTIWQMDL